MRIMIKSDTLVPLTLQDKVVISSCIALKRVALGVPFEHPIEYINTRIQANPHLTYIAIVNQTLKTGISGFYSGFLVNFIRASFKTACLNPLQGFFKSYYKPRYQNSYNLLTALSMAIIDTFLIGPLERIRTFQMTRESKQKSIGTLSNFYIGIRAVFTKHIVGWTSMLVLEENLRKDFSEKGRLPAIARHYDQKGFFANFFYIAIVGGVANLIITQPFYNLVVQLQKYNPIKEKRVISAAHSIWKLYGVKGFYAGTRIAFFKNVINMGLSSWLIQETEKIWKPENSIQSISS